jgi:hypothetical protein
MRPGDVRPKSLSARTKCPELEIGRNSVNPWMRPRAR